MRERNELILADLIAARAEQLPDFDVVTFDGGGVRPHEVRTYADLWMNGNRIAAGLIAKGLNKGDRFGLMMRNHPEFIETMVAASLTGGVFVPIDPRTKGEKLTYTLRNSECRGIVCADYALAPVAAVRRDLPNLEWMIVAVPLSGGKSSARLARNDPTTARTARRSNCGDLHMTAAHELPTHRQVAMVFDLNKCMGCQSCSVACKMLWTRGPGEAHQWWCTTNTVPGRGTPRNWEQMGGGYDAAGNVVLGELPRPEDFGGGWQFNKEEVFYGGKGQSVHLTPTTAEGTPPNWGPNWDEDQGAGEFPNAYYFYLPRICNHCTRPACVEACPSGAMYKRARDGIVLRDEDRCRGSRHCMRACPYKKIYFNHVRNVAQHCNLCFPRLEQGVAPACARNCPGRLIFVGMLDDARDPVHRLVHEWKVALPLHAEFGTEPNVFYVPPLSPYRLREDRSIDTETMRIPTAYLESLFGPGVHEALATLRREIERMRTGGTSDLLDTLIAYQWKTLFGPFDKEPAVVDAAREESR